MFLNSKVRKKNVNYLNTESTIFTTNTFGTLFHQEEFLTGINKKKKKKSEKEKTFTCAVFISFGLTDLQHTEIANSMPENL